MDYGIGDNSYMVDLPNINSSEMFSVPVNRTNTRTPLQEDIDTAIDRAILRTKQLAATSGQALARGLNYVTGIDLRNPVTQADVMVNPLAYGEVRQTGPVAPTTPRNVQPSAPVQVENGVIPAGTGTSTTTKEHPWTKFTSVDQAARSLNDADFKKFVDLNRDHPAVQGIGYMEIGTPGTKGYRLERVYPEPQSKTGYGVGGGKALSVGQMQGIAPILNARNAEDLRRQHLDQLTTANWFAHMDRQEKLVEQNKLKRAEDFQKNLISLSPSTPDDEKKPMVSVGMLRMMDRGMSPADMPGYEIQGKNLWDQREQMIVNEMTKRGIKYNAADINRIGTPTYNARQELIKHYENFLMGVRK